MYINIGQAAVYHQEIFSWKKSSFQKAQKLFSPDRPKTVLPRQPKNCSPQTGQKLFPPDSPQTVLPRQAKTVFPSSLDNTENSTCLNINNIFFTKHSTFQLVYNRATSTNRPVFEECIRGGGTYIDKVTLHL